MATRYYSFNVFMQNVIEKANSKIKIATNGEETLEDIFDITNERVLDYITAIMGEGWWVYIAVTALLILGPFGFLAAIGAFLLTGPGIIIAALFGAGAYKILRDIYRNKELPLAIREVGSEYKNRWQAIEGNHSKIDVLLDEATISLIKKAKRAQQELINRI